VRGNARDGVVLIDADSNGLTENVVTDNGSDPTLDSGIELRRGADLNLIDRNVIRGNADGLVDLIRCRRGKGNSGDNVTTACQ
jgi:hypothetical protein